MVCQDMGLNLLSDYCCWHLGTIVNYSTFRLVFHDKELAIEEE